MDLQKAAVEIRDILDLDKNEYKAGREISERELSELNLRRDNFHPEWNYTLDCQLFFFGPFKLPSFLLAPFEHEVRLDVF